MLGTSLILKFKHKRGVFVGVLVFRSYHERCFIFLNIKTYLKWSRIDRLFPKNVDMKLYSQIPNPCTSFGGNIKWCNCKKKPLKTFFQKTHSNQFRFRWEIPWTLCYVPMSPCLHSVNESLLFFADARHNSERLGIPQEDSPVRIPPPRLIPWLSPRNLQVPSIRTTYIVIPN